MGKFEAVKDIVESVAESVVLLGIIVVAAAVTKVVLSSLFGLL